VKIFAIAVTVGDVTDRRF